MPTKKEDLPNALQRSPKKVQRTYARSLDHAHEQYDSEEQAHRTAFAAVKHVAEKKGDHWEPKHGKGPSDPQAAKGTPESRRQRSQTRGGIDASKSKAELYDDARRAGIQGRSRMSKQQLVKALQKHSRRETARARS